MSLGYICTVYSGLGDYLCGVGWQVYSSQTRMYPCTATLQTATTSSSSLVQKRLSNSFADSQGIFYSFFFCKAFASLLLWQVRGMYRVQFKKNYFRTCYDCRHQVPISHICLILNITFILKLGEIVILILTDNVPQEEEKEEEGKGGKSEG